MRWKPIMLIVLLGTQSTLAERYFLGGGMSRINIDREHSAIGSKSGTGYQVMVGVMWKNRGLDLVAGGTSFDTGEVTDIYYPENRADYGPYDGSTVEVDIGILWLFNEGGFF